MLCKLLLNLSVTDTLFLLGLPMIMTTTVARRWVFGAVLCRVYYALTCVNMFTGTFTIMLMSIDRFVAVWWPVACNRSASLLFIVVANNRHIRIVAFF